MKFEKIFDFSNPDQFLLNRFMRLLEDNGIEFVFERNLSTGMVDLFVRDDQFEDARDVLIRLTPPF